MRIRLGSMQMANNPIPIETILKIRELWDSETIRYVAKCCEISIGTAKKYGKMSDFEVQVLLENWEQSEDT